jgi:hypothetical protein
MGVEKHHLLHSAATLHYRSLRLILALCAPLGLRLWTQDISQTYIQSEQGLLRDLYISPSSEFGLPREQVLRLLRPLYGLADSGDYWHENSKTTILMILE